MTIGEKLAQLRKQQHYTQEQLAELLDVSRQAVSKWESDISLPETYKLIQLAKLYDITLDELINPNDIIDNIEIQSKTPRQTSITFATISGMIYGVLWLLISSMGIIVIQEGSTVYYDIIFSQGTTQSTASIYHLLALGPRNIGNILILLVFLAIVFGLVLSLFMAFNSKLTWMRWVRFSLISFELLLWTGMLLFLIETITFNLVLALIITTLYWGIMLYDTSMHKRNTQTTITK